MRRRTLFVLGIVTGVVLALGFVTYAGDAFLDVIRDRMGNIAQKVQDAASEVESVLAANPSELKDMYSRSVAWDNEYEGRTLKVFGVVAEVRVVDVDLMQALELPIEAKGYGYVGLKDVSDGPLDRGLLFRIGPEGDVICVCVLDKRNRSEFASLKRDDVVSIVGVAEAYSSLALVPTLVNCRDVQTVGLGN